MALGSVKLPFKFRTPGLACTWGGHHLAACQLFPAVPTFPRFSPRPSAWRGKAGAGPPSPEQFGAENLTINASGQCEEKPPRSSVKLVFLSLVTASVEAAGSDQSPQCLPSLIPAPAAVQPEGDVSFAQTNGRIDWSSICMAWNLRN